MKKKEQKSGNKFWRASCHSARPRQYKTSLCTKSQYIHEAAQ